MESYRRTKSNTPAHIQSRRVEAKYKRAVNAISKNQRQVDQKYRIGERKNTATQRGIVSLLGNDIYLDPGIKHAPVLYGQNIPGFCYRRNGDARRPCSIHESKTSRVIHNLDGKEGSMEEEAANVVSDNPILDEILSCPQVLPILCDLRTTALLGRNPSLLIQFIEGLRQGTLDGQVPLFPFTQDAFTSLRKYRAMLIKSLFEAIRLQAELRLNSAANENGRLENMQINSASRFFTQQESDSWNQALLNKLEEIAAEENGFSSTIDNPGNPGNENDTDAYWKIHPVSSVLEFVDTDRTEIKKDSSKMSTSRGKVDIKSPAAKFENSATRLRAKRRSKFEETVRELISEVENVVDLGKMIREVRRKNPCRAHCSTGPLEKLLKVEMFTSLNSKYCSLLQSQGKVVPSEFQRCLAPTDFPENANNIFPERVHAEPQNSGMVDEAPKESPSFNFEDVLNKYKHASAREIITGKGNCQLKTKNRMCCLACKAKLRHGYEIFRERDQKFQRQIEQRAKTPGRDLRRAIENLTMPIGESETPSYDLYYSLSHSQRPSLLNLHSIHIQDSPVLELDEASFNAFPLSLRLSSLENKTTVTSSPVSIPQKVFPDLATPLSYAATPIQRFTAPAPSPGPRPSTYSTKSKTARQRMTAADRNLKAQQMSWTLKVSRYDLFKLRQELHRHSLEERMVKFANDLSIQNAESRKNVPISDITFHNE